MATVDAAGNGKSAPIPVLDPRAIEALAAQLNRPALANIHGGVDMICEDGEWLWQKSGDLLWRRTLHSHASGYPGVPLMRFPLTNGLEAPHSYAFVAHADAIRLRTEIRKLYEHTAGAAADTATTK
jgi:hypothetical protein